MWLTDVAEYDLHILPGEHCGGHQNQAKSAEACEVETEKIHKRTPLSLLFSLSSVQYSLCVYRCTYSRFVAQVRKQSVVSAAALEQMSRVEQFYGPETGFDGCPVVTVLDCRTE